MLSVPAKAKLPTACDHSASALRCTCPLPSAQDSRAAFSQCLLSGRKVSAVPSVSQRRRLEGRPVTLSWLPARRNLQCTSSATAAAVASATSPNTQEQKYPDQNPTWRTVFIQLVDGFYKTFTVLFGLAIHLIVMCKYRCCFSWNATLAACLLDPGKCARVIMQASLTATCACMYRVWLGAQKRLGLLFLCSQAVGTEPMLVSTPWL